MTCACIGLLLGYGILGLSANECPTGLHRFETQCSLQKLELLAHLGTSSIAGPSSGRSTSSPACTKAQRTCSRRRSHPGTGVIDVQERCGGFDVTRNNPTMRNDSLVQVACKHLDEMICKSSEHHRFGVSWRSANGIWLLVRQTSSIWLSNISGDLEREGSVLAHVVVYISSCVGCNMVNFHIYKHGILCAHTKGSKRPKRTLDASTAMLFYTACHINTCACKSARERSLRHKLLK